MLPDFPHFIKLRPEDKDVYNKATAAYPPYSDILFSTLHIWWNLYEKLAVSSLNGNIVINYQLPFDEDNSGYCLVGIYEIDGSIAIIFDHLRAKGQKARLVHVPEFVIAEITKKTEFHIEEEPDYSEYILDSRALANLEGSDFGHIRTQINRFLREVDGKQLTYRTLDLSLTETQDHLFQSILEWEKQHPPKNDPDRSEHAALKKTLSQAVNLDIQNLALYIDNKLHGVILYHQPPSGDHYVIHHLRFDYSLPYASDHLTHTLAKTAVAENVPFINMEMDMGKEGLRKHKMKLRPVKFYKKYTVKPAVIHAKNERST